MRHCKTAKRTTVFCTHIKDGRLGCVRGLRGATARGHKQAMTATVLLPASGANNQRGGGKKRSLTINEARTSRGASQPTRRGQAEEPHVGEGDAPARQQRLEVGEDARVALAAERAENEAKTGRPPGRLHRAPPHRAHAGLVVPLQRQHAPVRIIPAPRKLRP